MINSQKGDFTFQCSNKRACFPQPQKKSTKLLLMNDMLRHSLLEESKSTGELKVTPERGSFFDQFFLLELETKVYKPVQKQFSLVAHVNGEFSKLF